MKHILSNARLIGTVTPAPKWYPKPLPTRKNMNQLDPEIKALPVFQYGKYVRAGFYRCPVCGGFKTIYERKTDRNRECRGCKGTGKVLNKK